MEGIAVEGINVFGLGMNRGFNIACMHAAKRRYSTKIKHENVSKGISAKIYTPRNIPAIRYVIISGSVILCLLVVYVVTMYICAR